MASILKPEMSIVAALATGTMVYGLYQMALPSVADVRSIDQQNKDIESAERLAGWTSAALVSAVSLLAKDPTIFTVGAGMVVALSWWHRHADMVNPLTGKAVLGLDVGDFVPAQTQEERPSAFQNYEPSVF